MVTVVNSGSEATTPPNGPAAFAVVDGTDQPTSADAYKVLALGESASFPVSSDTFTIFVGDPTDPINKEYDRQTYTVGPDGPTQVSVATSADLPGGSTQFQPQ